jgi:hypothetical protein
MQFTVVSSAVLLFSCNHIDTIDTAPETPGFNLPSILIHLSLVVYNYNVNGYIYTVFVAGGLSI